MSDVRSQPGNATVAPFKEMLCVVACGDQDSGKSTLVSRLLLDHRSAVDVDAPVRGNLRTRPETARGRRTPDRTAAAYAKGISTEVSYRCFSTSMRQFILAELPDHPGSTRNAVAGASTASAAVVVIDVRLGVTLPARQHALLLALLGVRRVALVVNKMDLAGFAQHAFDTRAAEFLRLARALGLSSVTCIPACVLLGDNVSGRSTATPWYQGPTLRAWLDSLDIDPASPAVTLVDAPVSGAEDGSAAAARMGPPHSAPCTAADRVEATVVWYGDAALLRGRTYWLRHGARTVSATVTRVVHRIDLATLDRTGTNRLAHNEAGMCELALDPPLLLEPQSPGQTGRAFLLVDRSTHRTAGTGRLRRTLHDTGAIAWHPGTVDKAARAAQKRQTPCVVWFTGLPGAGKSTIADLVEQQLFRRGCHTCLLDGANLRHGLNKDLGFGDADRAENTRRIGEMARVMVEAGLIVLVASISPFRAERRMARSLVEAGEFFEVHVDTPSALAERRDLRGLYRKARSGAIRQFTGIDSPYEPPEHPELRIDTTQLTAGQAADLVIDRLVEAGVI